LIWVSTLPLTYQVLDVFDATGVWIPAAWPLWIIAVGWIVGLAIDAQQRRHPRQQT